MKKNAVLPYAIIAVVGIVLVIVLSVAGNNQRTTLENQAKNGGTEEKKEVAAPEDIFSNNCAACHANDLSGGMGPNLTKVGAKLSKDDIHDIILNGRGNMPAQNVSEEESQAVAGWLAEKK